MASLYLETFKRTEMFLTSVSMSFRVCHIFLDFKVLRYMKTTVFGVFEDLKFKISEGSDQN